MRIISETNLTNFEFWSGARDNANQLTYDELEQLEYILQDTQDEWTDTEINDLMWFEFDTILEWLGLELDDNGDIIRDKE